jgi:predicted enzyme related to lactoylglutathione lyase
MGGKKRFVRYEFRTTDTDAAGAFYSGVLGGELWGPEVRISQLPEQAIARGARPHCLGHLGVGDVDAVAERLVGLGAQRLGVTAPWASASSVVFRDPFGALVAVSSATAPPAREVVALHVLHTQDHEKAFAAYAALFGWTPAGLVDLGAAQGRHQGFAWDDRGAAVGSISDAARSPRIHPQWLFFFAVDDLMDKLAIVRARGGLALEPMRTPDGHLVAVCDDAQGAAFAMLERSPAAPGSAPVSASR